MCLHARSFRYSRQPMCIWTHLTFWLKIVHITLIVVDLRWYRRGRFDVENTVVLLTVEVCSRCAFERRLRRARRYALGHRVDGNRLSVHAVQESVWPYDGKSRAIGGQF